MRIALLTGGQDYHYAFGLAQGLSEAEIPIDFIGSDALDTAAIRSLARLRFLNLRRGQGEHATQLTKAIRIVGFYLRLVAYAWAASPEIFHVLWNNKFSLIDRVVLMVYYRALGKGVLLTAHNVNTERRDGRDSWLNRLTLGIQYRLSHQVFVHTEKMKGELVEVFGVNPERVSVIPYGINNAVPVTGLSRAQARERLRIQRGDKVALFFGQIAPYKGLTDLVQAFTLLAAKCRSYRLIIAGRPKKGFEQYWQEVLDTIAQLNVSPQVIASIGHIADEDVELYFKASDVLVLPYREIFQSGVLFLGYSFGVPAVATNVGSLREAVIDNRTGFVCEPSNPTALATTIERYFSSELFTSGESARRSIREEVAMSHSWSAVAAATQKAYERVLAELRA